MTAPSSRVVRVFISSTFRELGAERDLLMKRIFPELRRRRAWFSEVIGVDRRRTSRRRSPRKARRSRRCDASKGARRRGRRHGARHRVGAVSLPAGSIV
jgi:hypothetical protein